MADAGRILIMPKGNYNPSVSYEMLDLVFHNDVSWIAKKPVIGVEPSDANSDSWARMTGDATWRAEVDNIINGTTPVAKAKDADTVDGWHIYGNPNEIGFSGAFTMAQLCSTMKDKTMLHWVNTNGSSSSAYASDVPATYGMLSVVKRGTWCYATWIEINKKTKTPLYAGSWHSDSGWSGWSSTADCLPLIGGTLTNTLNISPTTGYPMFNLINNDTKRTSHFNSNSANQASWHNMNQSGSNNSTSVVLGAETETLDNLLRIARTVNGTQNVYKVVHTGNMADYVLPKTGGTFTNDFFWKGGYNRATGSEKEAQFESREVVGNTDNRRTLNLRNAKSGTIETALLLYDIVNGVATTYNVHHTGNKPMGTYAGDGSSVKRVISTGGKGRVLFLWSEYSFGFVTPAGGMFWRGTGSSNGTSYESSVIRFANTALDSEGELVIVGNNVHFNSASYNYNYQVL